MAMQRRRVELREQINAPQTGVDAIGDGYVHQAILPGQRHSGLGTLLGQREQPSSLTAAHNDREHVASVNRLPARV